MITGTLLNVDYSAQITIPAVDLIKENMNLTNNEVDVTAFVLEESQLSPELRLYLGLGLTGTVAFGFAQTDRHQRVALNGGLPRQAVGGQVYFAALQQNRQLFKYITQITVVSHRMLSTKQTTCAD